MDTVGVILGLSHIAVAVLVILMSVPLIRRKVKMNGLYGVRFRKSFESERNWYAINEYGGRQLVLWSIPLAVIGVVTLFLPLAGNPFLTIVLALAPLILLIPAFTSWLYSRKL
ncbi:MAG: SdpI family protein [Thermoanaerobaculia bacterium]|nr:SdpI family protein [Thermoanaerobaculia bacterium]